MHSINPTPILIPVMRAFASLGVRKTKGWELIANGHLVARKLGSRTMIEAESLRAYADSLPKLPANGATPRTRRRRG